MEKLSLFIKPWINMPLDKMIEKIKSLGFLKIEFPIRNGLFINPDNCVSEFKKVYSEFLKNGIEIVSVAGPVNENIFKAMAECGIKKLRIMLSYGSEENFLDAEKRFLDLIKEGEALCKKYDTKIIIQPHNGRFISNVYELRNIIKNFDSRYIGAIWDLGHSGLMGEIPSKSIDIIYDYLDTVNLKSAYLKPFEDGEKTIFRPWYTTGDMSPCDWEECVKLLKEKGYKGDFCTYAEYSDTVKKSGYLEEDEAEALLKQDIEYIKKIM